MRKIFNIYQLKKDIKFNKKKLKAIFEKNSGKLVLSNFVAGFNNEYPVFFFDLKFKGEKGILRLNLISKTLLSEFFVEENILNANVSPENRVELYTEIYSFTEKTEKSLLEEYEVFPADLLSEIETDLCFLVGDVSNQSEDGMRIILSPHSESYYLDNGDTEKPQEFEIPYSLSGDIPSFMIPSREELENLGLFGSQIDSLFDIFQIEE